MRLEEEWTLDIAPECPQGSEPLSLEGNDPLCLHSLFDEEERRRTMTEETRTQMQYVSSAEELIDVSLLIHLGLNRPGAQEYNMTQISSRLLDLTASAEVHISFQEYFSLDIGSESQMEPDIMKPNTCPQGFETIIVEEGSALIELSVCPFRQTHATLLSRHPFLGEASSQENDQPLSGIPFANYLSMQSPCGRWNVVRGFQHILLDQELISCVPCFPGAFCPSGLSLIFLAPRLCPLGTYNGWYGKQTIGSCRACPMLLNASEVSIFQGCDRLNGAESPPHRANGTNQSVLESPPQQLEASAVQLVADSVRVIETPNAGAMDVYDALDRQDTLQASISQWLASTTSAVNATQENASKVYEIHVILWEILD